VYDSFVQYQEMLLAEFRRLARRHGFTVIDARGTVTEIHQALRAVVDEVVRGMRELHVAGADPTAAGTPDDVQVTRSESAAPSG
jgi:type II secretory pathway component PulM